MCREDSGVATPLYCCKIAEVVYQPGPYPVVFVVRLEQTPFNPCLVRCIFQETVFLLLRPIWYRPGVVDRASCVFVRRVLDEESNTHADLDAKNVVRRARKLWISSDVAAQVNNVNSTKVLGEVLAHAVGGVGVYETAVGYQSNYPLRADAVRSPSKRLYIHVRQCILVPCSGVLRISRTDAAIQLAILSVAVIVIFVHLPRVVWRITNNHENRRLLLPLDALGIFRGHEAERCLLRLGQLERIHQANPRKRPVLISTVEVRVLDVQTGNVIRQQHDFVAVQLVLVFVLQVSSCDLLHDSDNEVAGADEGIDGYSDTFPAEGASKFFLQDLLDATHHEIDDRLRSIDDAVNVSFFG